MSGLRTLVVVLAVVALAAIVLFVVVRRRADFGTSADRATFRTLHTASLASPPLRQGLTQVSAGKSLRCLRTLLGAPGAAVTDTDSVLGWDGGGDHHRDSAHAHAGETLRTGATAVNRASCDQPDCPLKHVVTAPSPSTSGSSGACRSTCRCPAPA